MKRSTQVKLLLMGSATLILSACGDDKDNAPVFTSIEECTKTGVYTEEFCKKGLEEAQQQHMKTAPRFQSKEDCEKAYGAGQCGFGPAAPQQQQQHASGGHSSSGEGGSFFMPLMMGYMLGNMLNNNRPGYAEPQYRQPPSNYNAGGSNNSGYAKGRPSITDIPSASSSSGSGSSGGGSSIARGGFGGSAAAVGVAG